MVVYFSGTGNSRFCAARLATLLDDRLVNSAEYLRNNGKAELNSEKPWVFVCPIYAWQMPSSFEEFLRQSTFSGSREAYFVFTCGGDMGAAGKKAEELCRETGMIFKGALEVVMPDNFILMFRAPTEKKARAIIEKALPVLESGAELIRSKKDFSPQKIGVLDKIKSGPINKGFCGFYIKTEPFRVENSCTSCGMCEAICPLGNIRLVDGKPEWGTRCALCMGCINGCPEEAIQYGRQTKGKRRYRCPE